MSFNTTCPSCETTQRVPGESRGKKVSCPECGERYVARPAARKKSTDLTWVYLLVGLVVVLAVGGIVLVSLLKGKKTDDTQASTPPVTPPAQQPATPTPTPAPTPSPAPKPEEKPLVVTSDALRQQFAKDEVAAEQQYKNRAVEITGVLSLVSQEPPLRGLWFGNPQDQIPPVLCELAADQAGMFAKLKPGQKLTVRGTFLGKQQGFLGVGNCRVVPK